MVFPIQEPGKRIQTPENQLLRRPAVRQTQEIRAGSRLVDHEATTDLEQEATEQSWQQALAEATGQQEKAPSPGQQHRAMKAYTSVEENRKNPFLYLPVKQIMRFPVVTLEGSAGLNRAWQVLQDERVHYLLLLDDAGQPEGIISDRDLLQEAAGVGLLAEKDINPLRAEARDIIRQPIRTTDTEADIRDTARLMLKHQLYAVPVLDEQQQLVGIVTRSDLLLGLANQALEVWS